MTNEETRPLLIKVNPSWNRRSNLTSASTPPVDNSSRQTVPEATGEDVLHISRLLNGDTDSSWKINLPLGAILISVVFERMVFYGVVGNLVVFLNLKPFSWKIYHAVCATFFFFGITYIMSLFGGWISDSVLGRFRTILLAYVIYLCGYILLPFLAVSTDTQHTQLPPICNTSLGNSNVTMFGESCAWLIFIILILVAIAAGMLKANICPFGSDQLIRASQQTQLSFFNWFYWCINIGSFLGLGIIAYVEQRYQFLYGFIICCICVGISATIFLAGSPYYLCRPPDGSVLTNIFRIMREAFRNRREYLKLQQSVKNSDSSYPDADKAHVPERKIKFLDYAKRRYGGVFHNSLVDDVRKLGMILAVFAVMVPYWLVYFQMQTTFMFQGLNMRLFFGGGPVNQSAADNSTDQVNHPQLAVAWFSLCDAVFVIILLPLFDRIIYPRMSRAGYHFTFAKRMVLGMLFAAAAMVAAGIVEQFRWKALHPDKNETCYQKYIPQQIGNTLYHAADMTVLWQIPQYTLIGFSEVFASVACLQFAVMVAPKSMKAAVTGLYYFFCGFGSFLGFSLVAILSKLGLWFPNGKNSNMNCWKPCDQTLNGTQTGSSPHECHFDYYFYFLAGFEGLGLILFFIVTRIYNLNIDELTFQAKLENERRIQADSSKRVERP
ncbi:unnamed protein product [Candidula unifasciata]|uniref:Solute carrier family 15 member 4 n=1 Tax=Candidula unifasciata TaxID=100452 RepID=A0A8S3Z750_9EUPU|nr:unnamed protein product [Candidula unifasciata]